MSYKGFQNGVPHRPGQPKAKKPTRSEAGFPPPVRPLQFLGLSVMLLMAGSSVRADTRALPFSAIRYEGSEPEPGTVLVDCGDALPETMAAIMVSEFADLEHCNSPTAIPNGLLPNPNKLGASDLHCYHTLDFIHNPSYSVDVRSNCVPIVVAGGRPDDNADNVLRYAQEHSFPIVTASKVSLIRDRKVLDMFAKTLDSILRNPKEYVDVIDFFNDKTHPLFLAVAAYDGLYICGSPNNEDRLKVDPSLLPSRPIARNIKDGNLWSNAMLRFSSVLANSVSSKVIVVTSAPDENNLYPWSTYAPGLLALPTDKRNIYKTVPGENPPEFVKKTNDDFNNHGSLGNSYQTPRVAGYAARLQKNFPYLDAFSTKSIIYFHTIGHNYLDDPDGPKRGQKLGLRFLGVRQQKELAKFIGSSSDYAQTTILYATFCYLRYEESGFNNDVYDLWIDRFKFLGSKATSYYKQWLRTREEIRDQMYHDLIMNFFREGSGRNEL